MYFGDKTPEYEDRKEFYNAPIPSLYSSVETFRKWFIDYNVVTAKGNKYVVKENAMLCVLDFQQIDNKNSNFLVNAIEKLLKVSPVEVHMKCMTAKEASQTKCKYTGKSYLEYPHLIRIAGIECRNDCSNIPEDVKTGFEKHLKENIPVFPNYVGSSKQLQNWYSSILLSLMHKHSVLMKSSTIERNFVKSVFRGDDYDIVKNELIKFPTTASEDKDSSSINSKYNDIFAFNGENANVFIEINKTIDRINRLGIYYNSFNVVKMFTEEINYLKEATFETIFLFYQFIPSKTIYNIGVKFGERVKNLLITLIDYTKKIISRIESGLSPYFYKYTNERWRYIFSKASSIFKKVFSLMGDGLKVIYNEILPSMKTSIVNTLKWEISEEMKKVYLTTFISSMIWFWFTRNSLIGNINWINLFPAEIVHGILNPGGVVPFGYEFPNRLLVKFTELALTNPEFAGVSAGIISSSSIIAIVHFIQKTFKGMKKEMERLEKIVNKLQEEEENTKNIEPTPE